MEEKQINVHLNPQIYKELSVYCAENGKTKKDVVSTAIKNHLESEGKK